jgi:midasin
MDPLCLDIRQQKDILLSQLPQGSPYAVIFDGVQSNPEILNALSRALRVPSLTTLVAKTFRPLLVDLCARWLHDQDDMEAKFIALCELLQPHVELFP